MHDIMGRLCVTTNGNIDGRKWWESILHTQRERARIRPEPHEVFMQAMVNFSVILTCFYFDDFISTYMQVLERERDKGNEMK